MTKLEVSIGTKVKSNEHHSSWTHGLNGTVIKLGRGWQDGLVLVRFDTYKGTEGHDGDKGDDSTNCWWIYPEQLSLASDEIVIGTTTLAGDVGLPPQTRKVLAHLLAGKEITRLKADKVYGIVNLPDCIYRLREEGYDVVTTRAKDEEGRRYVVYSLPPKAAAVAA